MRVYQLPNYAIKIAVRWLAACKTGEKQTQNAYNLFSFDGSFTAGKQVSPPPQFFRYLKKGLTILLARRVNFYILVNPS